MATSSQTSQHLVGRGFCQEDALPVQEPGRSRTVGGKARRGSPWSRPRPETSSSLQEQVAFQGLVAELSSSLANLNSETVDRKVGRGLKALADHLRADRIAFLEVPAQGDSPSTICDYARPWLKRRGGHPTIGLPQLMERLKQGETFVHAEPSRRPAGSAVTRHQSGSRSTLAVSLQVDGEARYALLCDSVLGRADWPLDCARQVSLVGELLVNAVMRHRAKLALQNLSRRLIKAHEEERNRIARDLHDDVNQRLALLCLELAHLKEDCTENPGDCAGRVEEVLTQVRDLSSDVRRIHRQLNPLKLKSLGLGRSVRSLCQEVSRLSNIRVDFRDRSKACRTSDEVTLCLYRIAQEALHNVVKHSRATEARIELREGSNGIEMAISDSGTGFGRGQGETTEGSGLTGMRDRLHMVGGRLSIESGCDRGTRIDVWVPASRAAA